MTQPPPGPPNAQKFWIRADAGRAWGPYTLDAIGRISVGTNDPNRIQISTDGRTFEASSKFPAIMDKLAEAALAAAARKAQSVQSRPPPPPPTPRTTTLPPPEPEDPAPPPEGKIEVSSTIELYSRIASLQLTGQLTIHGDFDRFEVFFKKGTPEHVSISQPAAALSHFLIDKGYLTPDAAQQSVADAGGPDAELLPLLLSQGRIPSQDLFPLLGQYSVALLRRALTVESGRFKWVVGASAPAGSFSLGERWGLLCEWARELNPRAARRRLGDRISRAVYRGGESRAALDVLKLTAQEVRLVPYFDGTRSPIQIALELPGETELLYRTVLLLGDIGFLSFGPELRRSPISVEAVAAALEKVSAASLPPVAPDGMQVGRVSVKSVAVPAGSIKSPAQAIPAAPSVAPIIPPPPKAEAPKMESHPSEPPRAIIPPPPSEPVKPIVPPPKVESLSRAAIPAPPRMEPLAKSIAPPPRPARASVDLEALRALLEKWKKANHFEVLSVDSKASAAVIKDAYFALAKQYHPDIVPDSAGPELKKANADVTARINEAYQVIGDDTSRKAYIDELAEGEKVDVGPILQAEEDFLRATIMVKARKFQEAMELLERAIALNPREPEFMAWRAWARFASAKDKREEYENGLADCARVAAENPMCVAAHLFAGQMSKIMGDHAKAEAEFRKVLAIEPNNIDAARELRMARR